MMKRTCPLAVLAIAAAALAGCATTPGAEVTRFHLDQPIARGTVFIRPFSPGGDGLEFRTYATAVAQQLTRQGFKVQPTLNTAEQIATVEVMRGIRPSAMPARSPVTLGIGGGSFGGGVGFGLGTSFGIGKRRSNDVAITTLAVQIKRASDESVIWEGRAVGRTNAESSSGDEIARLAAALFRDFPGESGRTVEVK